MFFCSNCAASGGHLNGQFAVPVALWNPGSAPDVPWDVGNSKWLVGENMILLAWRNSHFFCWIIYGLSSRNSSSQGISLKFPISKFSFFPNEFSIMSFWEKSRPGLTGGYHLENHWPEVRALWKKNPLLINQPRGILGTSIWLVGENSKHSNPLKKWKVGVMKFPLSIRSNDWTAWWFLTTALNKYALVTWDDD